MEPQGQNGSIPLKPLHLFLHLLRQSTVGGIIRQVQLAAIGRRGKKAQRFHAHIRMPVKGGGIARGLMFLNSGGAQIHKGAFRIFTGKIHRVSAMLEIIHRLAHIAIPPAAPDDPVHRIHIVNEIYIAVNHNHLIRQVIPGHILLTKAQENFLFANPGPGGLHGAKQFGRKGVIGQMHHLPADKCMLILRIYIFSCHKEHLFRPVCIFFAPGQTAAKSQCIAQLRHAFVNILHGCQHAFRIQAAGIFGLGDQLHSHHFRRVRQDGGKALRLFLILQILHGMGSKIITKHIGLGNDMHHRGFAADKPGIIAQRHGQAVFFIHDNHKWIFCINTVELQLFHQPGQAQSSRHIFPHLGIIGSQCSLQFIPGHLPAHHADAFHIIPGRHQRQGKGNTQIHMIHCSAEQVLLSQQILAFFPCFIVPQQDLVGGLAAVAFIGPKFPAGGQKLLQRHAQFPGNAVAQANVLNGACIFVFQITAEHGQQMRGF